MQHDLEHVDSARVSVLPTSAAVKNLNFKRIETSKESDGAHTGRAFKEASNDSRDIAKVVKVDEEYQKHI